MVNQVLQKAAKVLGYQLSELSTRQPNPELQDYPCIDVLDLVMQDYVQQNPNVFFVQVGSHDGSSADPLSRLVRRYRWSGILVEPLPKVLDQLKGSYQDHDNLIYEQAAIAKQDGEVSFYTVRDDIPDLPFWVSQSSSLDREHMKGSLYFWKYGKNVATIPDNIEDAIKEILVPSYTIETLLKKHNVQQLDVLMLSTPGFDFEILKMFPFDQFKPPTICFEYYCLQERSACLKFLAEHGYSVGRFASRAIASLKAPTIHWTITDY
jgi:FkbM family methyltransferase